MYLKTRDGWDMVCDWCGRLMPNHLPVFSVHVCSSCRAAGPHLRAREIEPKTSPVDVAVDVPFLQETLPTISESVEDTSDLDVVDDLVETRADPRNV